MLGIRTALKPDLECSAVELVYGTTLRIPGDFFGYSQNSADLNPSDYMQRLLMTHLRATPQRAQTRVVGTGAAAADDEAMEEVEEEEEEEEEEDEYGCGVSECGQW
ncbi:hypothetical protein SprV_0301185600 [Sparganum proliferum]